MTTAIAQAVDGPVSIMENPTLNPAPPGERSFDREGTFVNPIFLGNSKKLLAFKLIDPTITSVPKCNANDECSSVTQWLRTKDAPNPPPANFEIRQWDNFVDNALILVQNILSEVNRQRAQVISVDPYQVMVKATRKDWPLEKTNFCFSVLPFLNEDNSAIGTRAFAFCKDVTIKAKGVEDLIWKNFINVTTEQSRTGKSGMTYNETVKLNVKTEAERMCALRNFYRKASLIQQKKLRR